MGARSLLAFVAMFALTMAAPAPEPKWTPLQRKRIQLQWIQWIQSIQWIQRIQQWLQLRIQQIPSPRLVTTDSQVYVESLNHLEDSSTDKLVNRHDYSYHDVIN